MFLYLVFSLKKKKEPKPQKAPQLTKPNKKPTPSESLSLDAVLLFCDQFT